MAVSTWRACNFVLSSFLFVICCILSFVYNIPSVLRIYDLCDDMYVHDPPQVSVSQSSVAQTIDGN